MPIKNVICHVCKAWCEDSTVRAFRLIGYSAGAREIRLRHRIQVNICELCLLDENEPIPFTVTEKGIADSMSRLAGEKSNA